MVGGLLLRGMSNRVVTPPAAAADVAAAMPAQPYESCSGGGLHACMHVLCHVHELMYDFQPGSTLLLLHLVLVVQS